MADTRKVLKIFLASPGDLADERTAAKAVVDEINGLFANAFGYHVELVGWEDTIAGFGRPQAIINAELDRCEFFIGLMWKRWGTRPDNSGPYTSGFEEEFARSIQRRKREGQPEISMFFKEIGADLLRDPGDELKKVTEFKKNLIDGKTVYYETFLDMHDFEPKIRRCVSHYVIKLQTEEAIQAESQNQAQPAGVEAQSSVHGAGVTSDTPFSKEGANFFHNFITKVEVSSKEDPVQPTEVARFRLLSDIVRRRENDPNSLGIHDANLLFAARENFVFGDRELMGLMASGLEHYSDENVPFWYWYAAADGGSRELLPTYSILGSTDGRRVGALFAMRLISETLRSETPADRKSFLNHWLAQDEAQDVKVAALSYLAEMGVPEDIAAIKQELARNNYHTKSEAVEAIIRINLRTSRKKAIETLYELQPANVERTLLNVIFEQTFSLSSETLLAGITHQSPEVRRIVVYLLRGRHALSAEVAEQLLTDDSASVRLEALRSLADGGRTFSDAQCRDILVKPSASRGLGPAGFGYDFAGEACLKQLQHERLKTLEDKELQDTVNEETIYDQKARFVLAERHFAKYGQGLRRAIDDQFLTDFAGALENLKARFEPYRVNVANIDQSVQELLRKQLTRDALDVICRKSSAEDLALVRKTIASGVVDYSPADIAYLSRFGEWEDIPLLVAAVNRAEAAQNTLLSLSQMNRKFREVGRAIYKIGRERFPEVLVIPGVEQPGSEQLLPYIIVEASDLAYRSLNDGSIMRLLRSENIAVRKAASLKCIRALPKNRLARILNSYMSPDEHHYYNVIHWLDFGLSGPRERAVSAAKRIMKREWLE
jgi:hypothetical protein